MILALFNVVCMKAQKKKNVNTAMVSYTLMSIIWVLYEYKYDNWFKHLV